MNRIIYWGLVTATGAFHFHMLFSYFSIPYSLLVGAFLSVLISLLFYQKLHINLGHLSGRWHVLLFIIQAMTLLSYWYTEIVGLQLLLFAGMEAVRNGWSNHLEQFDRTIEEYKKQQEHINETFRIVRSERHDFLKHISVLHFMLEKGEPKEAKSYLDELVDGYEETNLSIKGERGVVAGVLHQAFKRAKSHGISIHYDLDVPISSLPLTDKEVVSLVGNVLSNSIEASIDWQQEHKEQALITLDFYKRSGLFILSCKNDSLPIPTAVLDHLYQTYGHTTKTGEHEGLGTKIIQDIVKKYDGLLDFTYKQEQFFVKIKIPAVKY